LKLKFIKSMNKFIKIIDVLESHLDDLKHVNNVQYLFWAQEVAKSHWSFLIKDLKQPTGIWMVRHHDVTYKLGSFLGDKIEITTYIKYARGPLSFRIVDFHNKENGKLLVKVFTKWCYLDNLVGRNVIPIPELIKKLF